MLPIYDVPMRPLLISDCRDDLCRLATDPKEEVRIPNAQGSMKIRYDILMVEVDPEVGNLPLQNATTSKQMWS